MSEVLTPIVYQLGTGGIAGFVVGYAIKKLAKIVAVIAGLFFLALTYLATVGVINVHYDKLTEMIEGLIGAGNGGMEGATQWLAPIIANLPFAGTFVVGFALGIKMG